MVVGKGTRLAGSDWVEAALEVLLNDGPEAIAIQPLARQIGATKGSFYWHFATRQDLLGATLERWLAVCTEDVIAEVEASSDDPAKKARVLLARVTINAAKHPGQLKLHATADPVVRDALRRATERRIGYVTALLGQAGLSPAVAARRATIAYAAYLGYSQLSQAELDVLPATAKERQALLSEITKILLV